MVYTNADITKCQAAQAILAFADYWRHASGEDPGLFVFASKLTTYWVLDELSARGIDRADGYRHPQLHEDVASIKHIARPVRQIAVRNIGRDNPTLLITADTTTSTKNLFARYAERMLIENELSAYIKGFHLDALSSGLALNVDLDTSRTAIAGSLFRLFGRSL